MTEGASRPSLPYRADIDGLRAVAVLAVVFFHAGFPAFAGGFVGVDVFFVISGYLITSILLRDLDRGSFSLTGFYERRFRRLLPALTVMMAVTLGIGGFLLAPRDLEALGKSAVAASLFGSNILFYQEVSYFGRPAEVKALLHTWSLAVEEQFYLFFPILLSALTGIQVQRERLARGLTAVGAGSLFLSMALTPDSPSFAFFMIPTRIWELMIGAVVALRVLELPKTRRDRELLNLVGLGAVLYSVFAFDAGTPFPSWTAAIPTLGTALILHAGIDRRDTWTARVLSVRPMVFIGLVSYSLYLWHWPLLVYYKLYAIVEVEPREIWTVLGVIFLVSVLSWRYVEEPIRRERLFAGRRAVFLGAFFATLPILATGLVYVRSDGLPQRYEKALGRGFSERDPGDLRWADCRPVVERLAAGQGLCTLGPSEGPPRFLLMGDSHAQMLASGLDEVAERLGVQGLLATRDACATKISIDWEDPDPYSCEYMYKGVLEEIAATPSLEVVYLMSRWRETARRSRTGGKGRVWYEDVGKMIEKLGKTAVLVGPAPEANYDVPSLHYVASLTGRDINALLGKTFAEVLQRHREVDAGLGTLQETHGVEVLDMRGLFCGEGICLSANDGRALYQDGHHLSIFGSRLAGSIFEPSLGELARRPVRRDETPEPDA